MIVRTRRHKRAHVILRITIRRQGALEQLDQRTILAIRRLALPDARRTFIDQRITNQERPTRPVSVRLRGRRPKGVPAIRVPGLAKAAWKKPFRRRRVERIGRNAQQPQFAVFCMLSGRVQAIAGEREFFKMSADGAQTLDPVAGQHQPLQDGVGHLPQSSMVLALNTNRNRRR